jgi:uncharacterized membrane protein YcaP (DUF421 family)
MRLMGKRQIGEMQPFELVITLLIAELACIPMADTSIPLLYGIVSIITIYFLHQIVCLIDLHFAPLKYMISGKPSVVVNLDGIDEYQLKKNSMDISDLLESLRTAGYFSLSSVDYALYEANGTFSALPKAGYEEEEQSLPYLIIDEGKYNEENLKHLQIPREFFAEILKKNGIKNYKKVLVLTVDGKGKIYLQEKGKKRMILTETLPRGKEW